MLVVYVGGLSAQPAQVKIDSRPSLTVTEVAESPLYRVTDAILLDSGTVLIADHNGRRLSRVSVGDGRGRIWQAVPAGATGEFQSFTSLLRMSDQRVAVWDSHRATLVLLGDDGGIVSSRRLRDPPALKLSTGSARQLMRVVGAFSNAELLASSYGGPVDPSEGIFRKVVPMYLVGQSGHPIERDSTFLFERFQFLGGTYVVLADLPFGRRGANAVWRDRWYYTDGTRFEVQIRDADGQVFGRLSNRTRRRVVVSSQMIIAFKQDRLSSGSVASRADLKRALEWVTFPGLAPAYHRLSIDTDGTIWAQVWSPKDGPTEWDLFRPSGELIGSVSGPANLDLMDIFENHIVAWSRGDAGIESVVVHRLIR